MVLHPHTYKTVYAEMGLSIDGHNAGSHRTDAITPVITSRLKWHAAFQMSPSHTQQLLS